MKKTTKQLLVCLGFCAVMASFTSCNRGYGCPTNFSVNETVSEVVVDVVTTCLEEL